MPLWSVGEWRARIGSCWCALGRPFNTRFTRSRGKSRRSLTLHQLLTMVIMMMLLIVANLVLYMCTMYHDKSLSALFVGSNWKLHLLQLGLMLNLSSGVLMNTLQNMINHLLSHRIKSSLRQFCVDLLHSFRLIGQLIQILSYPAQFLVTASLNAVGFVFKKITENLENCIHGCELPQGSLKLSFLVILVVGAQLLVTLSISRAVIFLLLMTSGDVERNPGPEQSLTNTLSGSFHDSHYSFSILLFAISVHQFFHSVPQTTGTRGTVSMMMTILLLQAMAAVQTSLLMRSGDVETNPGPGRFGDLDYNDVDSNIILSEDNFNDVYQKVANISSRYYEFGIALGLPPAELDNIKEESKSPRALSGVLLAWLRQNYNTKIQGPPTWRKLVEAVDSSAGGNNHALAKAIASEHPIVPPSSHEASVIRTVSDCATSDAESDSQQNKSDLQLPENVEDGAKIEPQHTNNSSSTLQHLQSEDMIDCVVADSQQNENDLHLVNDKDETKVEHTSNSSMDTLPHEKDSDKTQSEDMTDGAVTDDQEDGYEHVHKPEEKEYSAKDVERTLNQLKEFYGLWKPIGLELGIHVGVINDIEKDLKGDPSRLQALIKQCPHSDNPTLTMKALLKVWQSEHVQSAARAFMKTDKILRKYYEVWKFIGTELDIDRNVMNTIEEDNSSDRSRLHALVEVWRNGDELTGTKLQDLNKALQSQSVVSAVAAVPITAENMERVFEVQKEHYRVWKTIGTELGVDVDTLSSFEKDHTNDEDRLHAIINSANPAPTHGAMTKVLQSTNITSAIAALPVKAEDVYNFFDIKWEHYKIWKIIGIELGIGLDTLNAIEKAHTDEENCLDAMIDGANPAPTRETMARVLQSTSISKAIAALPLKAKDVVMCFEVKREHYRVWKIIGTELGIDVDTLGVIEKDYMDNMNRLYAMIDSANPPLTHETIAKVLQSTNINKAVAALPDLKWQHYRIWRIIGTELGIDVEILNSIEKDHISDMNRLHAMIDNANPALTHEVITKVLQSERISNAIEAVLSSEEVNEILNLARNYYRSWRSIGLELGIDSAALDAIEKNHVNDHRRLIAMIDLWHSSVDLKPSCKTMDKALQSEKVTVTPKGVNLQNSVPLLKDGDYNCDNKVMVEGDIFTYPYYRERSDDTVCVVKILQPMTPAKNYFEFRILCPGVNCAITIGVAGNDYSLHRQPGWDEGIGYHADDGNLFNETGFGSRFGPTCTTGDRMGCGIDFESEDSPDYVKVFFTKNGQQVGDFIKFKKPKSARGLYPLMGMSSWGEQFQYLGHWHYLPTQEKGYEEELNELLTNEGHVELDISKVIITGAAGSGKTCTKLLLYKRHPPMQRQSTDLIEPMDRAYIKENVGMVDEHGMNKSGVKHDIFYYEESDSEYEWIVVEAGSETLYGMLAATVDSKEYKCEYKEEHYRPERHAPIQEVVSTPAGETLQSTKAESIPIAKSPSYLSPMKETTVKQKPTFERQDSEARRSLLLNLKNSDQKGVCVHKVQWIHLVDSGGQSQFHDILPTFLHHTSVIIYVLKLSETLDEQPFDDYYDEGQCVGDSRRAHYQVEQILKGVIQSAYYEKHTEENEKHTTKVLIVGTHKDKQTEKEGIDTKNTKLKHIFEPFVGSKQLEVLCHGDYNAEDIIFPLDAMKRDKESLSTGRDIRKRVINKGGKRVKVPISWFLLEEDMRNVGDKKKNGIVTVWECGKLADAINVKQLKNAFEYFHYLNIFLYFPHSSSLSNIIFTDPQIVVTIVSAFVKEAYQKVTDTEFKNFSERGEFTKSFVKSKLSRFLVPDAGFEEAEVIELLKITLVIAHIEEGRYFMPCVLPHCSLDEFEKERLELSIPPVAIKLPGDTHCVPRGFFCALVCGLMQKWRLRKEGGKLTDIYKNFVQFTVEECRVTVADTFFYVEIHVDGDAVRDTCKKIFIEVGEALKKVVDTHNYDNKIMSLYSLDFLCPCSIKALHTAFTTITDVKCKLNCTMDDSSSSKLEKKHSVWLNNEEYLRWEKLEGAATLPILDKVQNSPAQLSRTSSGFSEAMSNDEFMDYLKEEGLLAMDCSKLIDNGIGAKGFMDLTSEDIGDEELGISFGGRRVLKRVLKTICK